MIRKDVFPWRTVSETGNTRGINHTAYRPAYPCSVKWNETTVVSEAFRAKMTLTVRSCTRIS